MADHEDELIVAPKGKSKTRFLLTFLLVIMLLTTFSVGDEVIAVLTGRGGRGAYMSWTHPTRGLQKLDAQDFLLEKRMLTTLWSLLQGGQRGDRSDEETARFIIFSTVAEDAATRTTQVTPGADVR